MINCFSGNSTWHLCDASLFDEELIKFAETLQLLGLIRLLRPNAVEGAGAECGQLDMSDRTSVKMGLWVVARYDLVGNIAVMDTQPPKPTANCNRAF